MPTSRFHIWVCHPLGDGRSVARARTDRRLDGAGHLPRGTETVSQRFGCRAHSGQAHVPEAGAACKRTLDRQYHRYGFHCHTARLMRSKPKPPEVFTRKVDVGGFRLAISCRGNG